MLRQIAITTFLVTLFNVSPAGSGIELSTETLSYALKKLGIYNNNKVPINGQTYQIENVSVHSNRRDFIIRFSAKPIE